MPQILWLCLANIFTIPTQIAMLKEQQKSIQDIVDDLEHRQQKAAARVFDAAEMQPQNFILDEDQPVPSPTPSSHERSDDTEVIDASPSPSDRKVDQVFGNEELNEYGTGERLREAMGQLPTFALFHFPTVELWARFDRMAEIAFTDYWECLQQALKLLVPSWVIKCHTIAS